MLMKDTVAGFHYVYLGLVQWTSCWALGALQLGYERDECHLYALLPSCMV
jgi:hypothetical protein